MKAYCIFFIHASLVLLFKFGLAQDQPLKLYRIPLPPRFYTNIHAGVQDREGYMWFAADDGLYRYDGYTYVSYLDDPLDPNSLVSHHIETIYADRSGFMWIGSREGLDRFDPATGDFMHFFHGPNNSSLSNNEVKAIFEDHEGMIWVGTHKGLNRLDPKTKSITRYLHKAFDSTTISNDDIRIIYEDRQGTLWIGTGDAFAEFPHSIGGLNRFNRTTGNFTRYLHDPKDPHSLIDNRVRAIFEDSRGVFWVGTAGDGLHIMDRKKGSFERYAFDPAHPEKLSRPAQKKIFTWVDDHITFITEDVTGAIWIGTFGNGMNRYDPVTKKVTYFSNTEEEIGNVKIDAPWWACNSRDGVLWIGYWKNLYCIDPLQVSIPYFPTGKVVYSFYEDSSGMLWYGGDFGLVRKDRIKGTEQHFVYDVHDPMGLSDSIVISIYEDKQGTVWVGTSNGLNRFNKENNSFTHYKPNAQNPDGFTDNAIENMYEDRYGNFWVGTYEGSLHKMNRREGTFFHYRHNPRDSNSISADRIKRIYEDREGNLWIGTYGGGLNLMTSEGKFRHFLQRTDVNSIVEDFEGILWVATAKGLYSKDKGEQGFRHFVYPGTQMTDDIVVIGLLEDKQKALWMNTSIGILRLNRERNDLVIYGENHGINKRRLDTYANAGCYSGKKGELFFGDGNGYYSFFPGQLSKNARPPQILINQFRLGDEIIEPSKRGPLKKLLADAKEIRLQYDQNFFSFDFTGIHYSNPAENRHLFMLEGLDKNWRVAVDQRTAYYPKVPTGNYVFRVKASNSDGVWAEKSIAVIVLPPWSSTWWAYVSYGVIFLVALIIFITWREKTLRSEKVLLEKKVVMRTHELQEEKEKAENTLQKVKELQAQLVEKEKINERLRISRELHDDIGSTLGSISIYSEVAKKRTEKHENTDEVISKIGFASRELIDRMSDIVWSLNPNNESFEQLQNRMMAFAAMILTPQNIPYDFFVDEALKQIRFTGGQRKNIFLIFKEALHNIVKYADSTTVHISLSSEQNNLIMIIRDNGKGFDDAQLTRKETFHEDKHLGGNGIKNMHTRADDLHARLCISSAINEGTTVQLTMHL